MSRRLSTLFCRYEPRLLSRSITILNPSTKTCCSIVWSTFEGPIGFSASLFGMRFRVEGGSARMGAILIQDRNLWRERGQRGIGILPSVHPCDSAGETPTGPIGKKRVLHNPLPQQLVFSGKQILHEIITAFIGVAGGAGEMMIDSHSRRATEIIRNGKNFVSGFTLAD